jgi:VWFA-related protein
MRAIQPWAIVGLFVILLALLPVNAAAQDIADVSVEWVDASEFPVNIVYYSTNDSAGQPAGAMWVPDQVSIYEGGVEHRPWSFEDDDHAPAHISVIIDSSGSMEGSLEEVLEAARMLIDQFDDQDRAEIVDFDSAVVTRRSFTDDPGAMRSALEEIEVGGGTALYDAVAIAFDHLAPREGMKAVLVLSDGEDENSTAYTYDALKGRLAGEGVRVFTIALGEGVDTTTMSEIAELSGGTFYRAAEVADVEDIYTEVITYLHSLHRMWYSTSQGMFDGSRRQIEVEHHPSGSAAVASYEAPRGEFWSHALDIRRDNHDPVEISPDGRYAAFIQHRAVVTADGRRLTYHDWEDLYGAELTSNFLCGYLHRAYGELFRYEPGRGRIAEADIGAMLDGAAGEFHAEWAWHPKAISPGERYVVMAADPGDEFDYDYYFMLFDRTEDRVLWERGLYIGEFDEPGPAAAADTGRAAVVQEDNLYIVEPSGEVSLSLTWPDTGKRWQRLAMSGDGAYVMGRNRTGGSVWAYRADGTLLWEKRSQAYEHGGFVSISPNGRYFAYADRLGPHILNAGGSIIFELTGTATEAAERIDAPRSVDVANDGSFVYALGSRMYYRQLAD